MVAATLPADAIPPTADAFKGPNPLLGFTGPFNMSRNPTLSLPGGDGKGAPPPSLQLVGRRLGEATLLRLGGAFERATEWHKQRPSV
jgi:amidase